MEQRCLCDSKKVALKMKAMWTVLPASSTKITRLPTTVPETRMNWQTCLQCGWTYSLELMPDSWVMTVYVNQQRDLPVPICVNPATGITSIQLFPKVTQVSCITRMKESNCVEQSWLTQIPVIENTDNFSRRECQLVVLDCLKVIQSTNLPTHHHHHHHQQQYQKVKIKVR